MRNNTPAGNDAFFKKLDYSCVSLFFPFIETRFKTDVVIARGTFGKVIVERLVTGGTGLEPIFEFNLHKVYPLSYLFILYYHKVFSNNFRKPTI